MVNYSSSFTALYDACVLYPPSIRDILLELAAHSELFRAKWTEEINNEWIEALLERRDDFLVSVYALDQDVVQQAVKNVLDRLTNLAKKREEFLSAYEENGLDTFAKKLRQDNWLL